MFAQLPMPLLTLVSPLSTAAFVSSQCQFPTSLSLSLSVFCSVFRSVFPLSAISSRHQYPGVFSLSSVYSHCHQIKSTHTLSPDMCAFSFTFASPSRALLWLPCQSTLLHSSSQNGMCTEPLCEEATFE